MATFNAVNEKKRRLRSLATMTLYANRRSKRGHRRHAEPDWPTVHRELKRKHVTLVIVWDEYIAANPGGYSYSRYVAAVVM